MSFECQFCKKSFKREKTLAVHLCEQKRRWINRDEKYVRLGFLAYNRFYEITQGATKQKTYEHFTKSNYYTGFTRFGKHTLEINAIDPERFIDFVITNSIALDKWCSDAVYETYIRELNKKETAERAIERGILLMQQWSRENDRPYMYSLGKLVGLVLSIGSNQVALVHGSFLIVIVAVHLLHH